MSGDFCLGPPCGHFPPGTTREEAIYILALRTLMGGTQVNYVCRPGSPEANRWRGQKKIVDRFVDEEVGA